MARDIEKKNRANRDYYHRNKERLREEQRIRSKQDYTNPEKAIKKIQAQKKYRLTHPEREMFRRAKNSAPRRGIEFNLQESDIIIPEICPVFGIKLEIGGDIRSSPSLDRIDNTKGYTKDNIWVISNRANSIKRDASIEELEQLVAALKLKTKSGVL